MFNKFDEKEILKVIEDFEKILPKFPDGRINYKSSDKAPVIVVLIKHKDKVLLLKRSDKVSNYPEKWSIVAGYLDEVKPVREKVLEELEQELGIKESAIFSMNFCQPYEFTDKSIKKTWLRCPVVVELKKIPEIHLDWEHTDFKWVTQDKINSFDIIPSIDKVLRV